MPLFDSQRIKKQSPILFFVALLPRNFSRPASCKEEASLFKRRRRIEKERKRVKVMPMQNGVGGFVCQNCVRLLAKRKTRTAKVSDTRRGKKPDLGVVYKRTVLTMNAVKKIEKRSGIFLDILLLHME